MLKSQIIVLTGLVVFALTACQSQPDPNAGKTQNSIENTINNLSYTIEKEPVQLVDGAASQPIVPDSASTTETQLYLYELLDLNGDDKDDAVVILLQQSGGSGSFYYVSVALRLDEGFKTLDAVLLGDRITPTKIVLDSPHFVVQYKDRKPGQSMAEEPTVVVRQPFIVDNEDQQIVLVARDFEGEADPNRMTLSMKPWTWITTQYNNDTTQNPKKPGDFILEFQDDNAVTVKTDCNTMRGKYMVEKNRLSFDKMMWTRMYCEGSVENAFSKTLEATQSFFFTTKGELVLELKYDTGSATFR
jgi:heat shock protein HslJ